MHDVDQTMEQMVRSVLAYAENRLRMDPVPLDRATLTPAQLYERLGGVIREAPRDPDEVLGVYSSVIAPSVISADSPRFLGFIPAAPTKAACSSTCSSPAPRSKGSPGWRRPGRSPRRTRCSG